MSAVGTAFSLGLNNAFFSTNLGLMTFFALPGKPIIVLF